MSRAKYYQGCSHFVWLFSTHFRAIWFSRVMSEFCYLYQNYCSASGCILCYLILNGGGAVGFSLNTEYLLSVSGQHSPSSSYCPGDLPCHVTSMSLAHVSCDASANWDTQVGCLPGRTVAAWLWEEVYYVRLKHTVWDCSSRFVRLEDAARLEHTIYHIGAPESVSV